MNFLLLGYGSIGKRHAAILRDLGHDVTTVDPDPEAGADWLRYQAAKQTEWDGLLDCTPPDVRAGWAIQGTFRGRFVEKPLGSVMHRYPPPPTMMGFCYHWDKGLQEFVSIVKGARIHALKIEGGQYLQDWHAEDYQTVKHRYRGVVTDSLPHSLYIARWILGDLYYDGHARANTGHFDIKVEDRAAMLLTSQGNTIVQLYADYLMRPRRFSIDAYGIGRHYHWEFSAGGIDTMYRRQMQAFVNLCSGGIRDNYPNLEDGAAVQEILDAVL